jgi:transcriptional regulator with PAS, ATPase and Fis domain
MVGRIAIPDEVHQGQDAEADAHAWPADTTALVGTLVRELSASATCDIRVRFEQIIASQSGFPDIRLRERATNLSHAPPPDAQSEPSSQPPPSGGKSRQRGLPMVAIDVPWSGGIAVLEVRSSHRSHLIDERRLQIVRAAVPVAAVVLDVERDRRAAAATPASATSVSAALASEALAHAASPGAASSPLATEDAARAPFRLTGTSAVLLRLRGEIERAARTDFTVLIEGETGAGKEMVAHQIHEWSRRRHGPWVAVNCAAIVDTLVESELFGIEDRTATGVRGRRGKFEMAHGGTLFLDEVADLSPQVQAKLLRVLQDMRVERVGGHELRRISARVIVATNRSLASLVQERVFRPDLFYRLHLLRIHVPPLRERLDDLLELVHVFLHQYKDLGISRIASSAVEVMGTYAWPGNIRELHNVVAQSITRAGARGIGEEITVADLPEAMSRPYCDVLQTSMDQGETMRLWKARYARLMLERCGGDKKKTCERLDISYHTLRSYLRQGGHG